MNDIERRAIQAVIALMMTGLKCVTEEQILDAIIPHDDPGAKSRPSYVYAVERMVRRGLLSSQWEGTERIGYIPTEKAYAELDASTQD
jgi:hypothetical protein